MHTSLGEASDELASGHQHAFRARCSREGVQSGFGTVSRLSHEATRSSKLPCRLPSQAVLSRIVAFELRRGRKTSYSMISVKLVPFQCSTNTHTLCSFQKPGICPYCKVEGFK